LIDAKVPRTAEGDRRVHPAEFSPAVTAEKNPNDVVRPNAGTAGCASTAGKAFPFLTSKICGGNFQRSPLAEGRARCLPFLFWTLDIAALKGGDMIPPKMAAAVLNIRRRGAGARRELVLFCGFPLLRATSWLSQAALASIAREEMSEIEKLSVKKTRTTMAARTGPPPPKGSNVVRCPAGRNNAPKTPVRIVRATRRTIIPGFNCPFLRPNNRNGTTWF
jgi:hypothetical protein